MKRKRPKSGLGQVLLRALTARKSQKKKLRIKTRTKKRASSRSRKPSLKLSIMQGRGGVGEESVLRKKRGPKPAQDPNPVPKVQEVVLQEVAPQVLPQPVPSLAAVAPVASEVPLPAVAVAPALPVPSASSSQRVFSTQDFLNPGGPLRQSIEAFLMDQRSPHTRRAYGKDLKRFVQFLHGRKLETGVEQLGRAILIAYKESLISEKLQHTTVDRHVATLRSFFQWLVDDGLLDKSPADGVRFLNPKRLSSTIGFSDEEVKRVLMMPDLHRRTGALHYAVLMILFYCGLRRSEVCDLRTTSLGEERNQKVLRLKGKGNAERVIVVVPPVWNAIQYYFYITGRSLGEDASLFIPIRNNRTGDTSKPLDPSMIFYIVRKYARQAGIANRVSPHSCRATAISNARDHQVPDRAIQEFAGWSSTQMITRYDKRKTSVENSAARAISYGAPDRSNLPAGTSGRPKEGPEEFPE